VAAGWGGRGVIEIVVVCRNVWSEKLGPLVFAWYGFIGPSRSERPSTSTSLKVSRGRDCGFENRRAPAFVPACSYTTGLWLLDTAMCTEMGYEQLRDSHEAIKGCSTYFPRSSHCIPPYRASHSSFDGFESSSHRNAVNESITVRRPAPRDHPSRFPDTACPKRPKPAPLSPADV
jgi:hypothetical protein